MNNLMRWAGFAALAIVLVGCDRESGNTPASKPPATTLPTTLPMTQPTTLSTTQPTVLATTQLVVADKKSWKLGSGMSVELPAEWKVTMTGVADRWIDVRYGGSEFAFRAAEASICPKPEAAIPGVVEDFWGIVKNKREVSTPHFTYTIGGVLKPVPAIGEISYLRGKLAVRDVTKLYFSRVWFWGRGDPTELNRIIEAVNAGLRSDGVLAAREATDDELSATHVGKGFTLKLPREGLTSIRQDGDALVIQFDDPESGGQAHLGFAVFDTDLVPPSEKVNFKIGQATIEYFRVHPERVHPEWVKRPQAHYRLAWHEGVAPGKINPATVFGNVGPRPESIGINKYLWFWGNGDQLAINGLLLYVRQGYRLTP